MGQRASKKDREQFVAIMSRELTATPPGVVALICNRLMRQAATYSRLQEAACNGDYPADGPWAEGRKGALLACPRCEGLWARSKFVRGVCPDCACEDRIKRTVSTYPLKVRFQGDPRGATIKLVVPSGYTNDCAREGVCVPNS